jgi:hypothetical protein
VKFFAIAAAAAFAAITPASAQPAGGQYELLRQYNQRVKSGSPTRVYTWWNCNRPEASGHTGTARNGTVTARPARQNRCGVRNYPVTEMIYTSNPGFRGKDEVWLYSHHGGRAQKTLLVE